LSDVRQKRWKVEKWINEQEVCPSRKEATKQFPDAPQRVVRALLQARQDREREAS